MTFDSPSSSLRIDHQSIKRPISNHNSSSSVQKRRRIEHHAFTTLMSTALNLDCTLKENCVVIHPNQVHRLWPKDHLDCSVADDTSPRYVQIAAKVYQALTHSQIGENSIGISTKQLSELGKAEGSALTAIKFDPAHLNEIKQLTFLLSLEQPTDPAKNYNVLPLEMLCTHISQVYAERVIDPEDRFYIELDNLRILAEVSSVAFASKNSAAASFGKIGPGTVLEFITASSQALCVYDMKICSNENLYVFEISLTQPKGHEGVSYIMDIPELEKLLFHHGETLEIVKGGELHFYQQNGAKLTLQLSSIRGVDGENGSPSQIEETWSTVIPKASTSSCVYDINKTSLIKFKPAPSEKNILFTCKADSMTAPSLTFEISTVRFKNSSFAEKQPIYIEARTLEKLIRSASKYYLRDQKITLSTEDLEISLKVHTVPDIQVFQIVRKECAEPEEGNTDRQALRGLKKYPEEQLGLKMSRAWTCDRNTLVQFDCKLPNTYILENQEKQTLKSLEIDVKAVQAASSGGLFGMFSGEQQTPEVDEELLLQQLRHFFKKGVLIDQKYHFEYQPKKDAPISFKLRVHTLESRSEVAQDRPVWLGLLDEQTEIGLHYSGSDLSFKSENSEECSLGDNPIAQLKDLGMGGLSETFKRIIQNVLLSRSHLRSEAIKRGITPVRGLLLYGPPGTGKTTLAKNIANILGCPKSRLQLVSAPSIFNKYVGNSEKNVRKWFEPARKAYEKLGDESPLYMVVVDEIDAILSHRENNSGNPTRNSVVNQFLTEMDGLHQLNNILFIGMTNRIDQLDPAAVRSGRFGEAVEIGYPDEQGRKEIFDVYLKSSREAQLLHEEVVIEKYLEVTEGFSGADIKALVEKACSRSLHRLYDLQLDDSDIGTHAARLITQDDFDSAFKEMIVEMQNKPKQH